MAFVKSLIIILHTIHPMKTIFNQYEMVNDSFWRSTSTFKPTPASQYGTIQLLHSLRMEFKLVFYGRNDYENWQNIFRIGYKSTNNSCYGYGSRYPSLWLSPDQDQLSLSISQLGNCHYGPWSNYPIQKNITYFIIIQFNDTWVYMEINNEIHINEQRQSQTLTNIYNQHLAIWISTDKTKPATEDIDIILSNITIKTWNTEPTKVPSNHPTNHPTITPSKQPTETSTYHPVIHPTPHPIVYTTSSPLQTTSKPIVSKEESETSINTNRSTITEQNILFLLVGVLLSSTVCLSVMGTLLLYFCCHQMTRDRKVRYHRPRRISLQKVKKVRYDSENSMSMMRRNTSMDVAVGTESGNKSQSEIEGVLEETILDIEGYGMLDEEVIAAANCDHEGKFAGMLNNANVVNDIILDDIIAEMATSRNAEMSSDEDIEVID